MRDPLSLWAASSGDAVRTSAAEIRHADRCLVVTRVEHDGLWAEPALSWLLPRRPLAPIPAPLERAYAAVHRASLLLATRRDAVAAARLMALANVILSRGPQRDSGTDEHLAAECRTAADRLGGRADAPLLLADLQGWFGRSKPSLLDRTVGRLFGRLSPYQPGRLSVAAAVAIGRGLGMPSDCIDESVHVVYAAAKRAQRHTEPGWIRLTRRFAQWPLAEAATHAVHLLTTRFADRPRVHRAILGPAVGLPSARVIQALLCWSVAPPSTPSSQLTNRVAARELAGQLAAYSRVFLDGQRSLAALGLAPR
jgi:hypothetical protein